MMNILYVTLSIVCYVFLGCDRMAFSPDSFSVYAY